MNKLILLIIFPFFIISAAHGAEKLDFEQPEQINLILKKEKTVQHADSLINIINSIDNVYGRMSENLENGGKIIVFLAPAHGMLPNGQWHGGAITNRLSCTMRPEEHYSLMLSREIYKLLISNPHIEVQSTPDYLEALQGKKDIYNHITFEQTVDLAKSGGAFIIISEHLNNVSMIYKAGGLANIPGIHITMDNFKRKHLSFVKEIYSGFLTLYNKLDASGFSQIHAIKLKEKLVSRGLKANNWEFGAVGDTRFCYFVDFPISVIYESGFISNPAEEEKLRDSEYIKIITESQYEALIENLKDIFGIDISGKKPQTSSSMFKERIELLKLTRIAIYYIEKGKSSEAISVIKTIEKLYSKTDLHHNIKYYSDLKNSLQLAEKFFSIGNNFMKKGETKKANSYYVRARRILGGAQIFSSYQKKYRSSVPQKEYAAAEVPQKKAAVNQPIAFKSKLETPVILALEGDQSLREALIDALEPDEEALEKMLKSFKKAKIETVKTVSTYSKKYKKYINVTKRIKSSADFTEGIYVVQMNRKLDVVYAKRMSSVHLDPAKYQNQLYLKNSYFAASEKEKSL